MFFSLKTHILKNSKAVFCIIVVVYTYFLLDILQKNCIFVLVQVETLGFMKLGQDATT